MRAIHCKKERFPTSYGQNTDEYKDILFKLQRRKLGKSNISNRGEGDTIFGHFWILGAVVALCRHDRAPMGLAKPYDTM